MELEPAVKPILIFFLPVMFVAAQLWNACMASGRDHDADLVVIATRFVEAQSRVAHKAGDADGQFIEDVVTPSVLDVVQRNGAGLTRAQREAILGFLVASRKSASEEVSEIAVALYRVQPSQACRSLSILTPTNRTIVLNRIRSGLAVTGKPIPRAICPRV